MLVIELAIIPLTFAGTYEYALVDDGPAVMFDVPDGLNLRNRGNRADRLRRRRPNGRALPAAMAACGSRILDLLSDLEHAEECYRKIVSSLGWAQIQPASPRCSTGFRNRSGWMTAHDPVKDLSLQELADSLGPAVVRPVGCIGPLNASRVSLPTKTPHRRTRPSSSSCASGKVADRSGGALAERAARQAVAGTNWARFGCLKALSVDHYRSPLVEYPLTYQTDHVTVSYGAPGIPPGLHRLIGIKILDHATLAYLATGQWIPPDFGCRFPTQVMKD